MLLTLPMMADDGQARDEAEAWAIYHERGLRELRWRVDRPDDVFDVIYAAILEKIEEIERSTDVMIANVYPIRGI